MRILFPLSPYNQQRQFQKPAWVYPVHLAMYATYLRDRGHEIFWDESRYDFFEDGDIEKVVDSDSQIGVPFKNLPYPDRELTDATNKRWQAYGNYKFHPATHMMVSNLCWYGRCTFCVDAFKIKSGDEPRYVRPVLHVIEEIDELIRQGYREVFDDSGTFPVGNWLDDFCRKAKKRKIVIGCNMKPIMLDFEMMKAAGFRFVLVGLESANQETLDRLCKGQKAEAMIQAIKAMAEAGLEVHATCMFGYEWETHEDAMRTVNLIHSLLKKGYIKTVQASIIMPPRTPPPADHPAKKYIQRVYDVYKQPWYWCRKVKDIKRLEDLIYLLKRIDHLWTAR